jgi:tetratricopeptide (TPR) repeat protein
MELSLAQKAISFALQCQWKEAVQANLEILRETPEDVDALNRLARAYSELGKLNEAKATAQKVLDIDPVNTIAQKCLDKWKSLKAGDKGAARTVDPEAFLEEPGKTKIVNLLNPGDAKVIGGLDSGDEVKLLVAPHRISVVTPDGKYIGRLPDDLAARLKNLIKSGNKYRVLVKSIEPKEIDVFIRETEKGEGVKNVSSFSTEKIDYVSFTPPELIHKEAPIAIGEDLEEAEGV